MIAMLKQHVIARGLAILLLGLTVPIAHGENLSPMEIARKSVVTVLPVWPGRPANLDEPAGSGVVLGDGRTIVTADHVLGPARTPVPVLVRDDDGTGYRARIVARHKASDLAVLRIDEKLPALAEQRVLNRAWVMKSAPSATRSASGCRSVAAGYPRFTAPGSASTRLRISSRPTLP